MERLLGIINSIPGVIGSIIFGDTGECVAHQLSEPYEPILLSEILPLLEQVDDISVSLDGISPIQSLALNFSEGSLFVRKSGPFTMMVIANSDTNPARLSVAFNLVLLKLQRAHPEHNSSSQRERTGSSQSIQTHTASFSHPQQENRPPRQSPPAGMVSIPILRHVLNSIEHYAPKLGKRFLQEELLKLGVDIQTLPFSSLANLIQNISMKMPPQLRKMFIVTAMNYE